MTGTYPRRRRGWAGGEEQLGTKPKQWLRDPLDRLWLWKATTWNSSSTDGSERVVGVAPGLSENRPIAKLVREGHAVLRSAG